MTTDETGALWDGREVEQLRATERQRLRAVVEADVDVARRLHADDFQLISPAGRALSKAAYLGGIASGVINYLAWEPAAIAVRRHDRVAFLRYQASTEIIVAGQPMLLRRQWHTDISAWRDGRWQVVWSPATAIVPASGQQRGAGPPTQRAHHSRPPARAICVL